jgi:predicted cation transporter
MVAGLVVILLAVLVLPFAFHRVEKNIEFFLFAMGLAAALVGGGFDGDVVRQALVHPLPITLAVLAMGFAFKWGRRRLEPVIARALKWLGPRWLTFAVILVLGGVSSVITVIIAALLLVEYISVLRLERKAEVHIVVTACFALGLGAGLTPLGEPLSTLAVSKLTGPPHYADFWFLFRHLGLWILPGVLGFAAISLFFHEPKAATAAESLTESVEEVRKDESYRDVFMRAAKVFVFVMALVFLGEGFKPLVDIYVLRLSPSVLYWVNTASAVLDNATLAAAEISPAMDLNQIRDVLLGLLLAGGILVPGNIPNIIAASKLRITMKEWVRFGIPLGLASMAIYFVLILALT